MKILPYDLKCFNNASNLEEVEFWLQTIWSLISQVPEDLTWWFWVFWQCEHLEKAKFWLQNIWWLINDHWSVMCTWRSYLMILSVLTMQSILRMWNFDCRLYDHWSMISHVYLKILPDDPECFHNVSNLEEVEFWLQTIWSLINDQSCVHEDLTWWSWMFWGGGILKLYDHWSLVSHVYLKILHDDPGCFDNRAIFRR